MPRDHRAEINGFKAIQVSPHGDFLQRYFIRRINRLALEAADEKIPTSEAIHKLGRIAEAKSFLESLSASKIKAEMLEDSEND